MKYYISIIIYKNIEITRMFSNFLNEFLDFFLGNIRFINLLENYLIKINLYSN
jgi:hypothetical protein